MPKILMVFLKFKNRKEIFTKGTVLYLGKEVTQISNNDGIEWDEIKVITYSDNQSYKDDINDFDKVKNDLVNYRVILTKSPSKLRFKYEMMKMKFKNLISSDDTSITLTKKERPSQKKLRLASSANAENVKNFLKWFTQHEGHAIYIVNLIKFHDIAQYPEGYEGKKISGKKAFAKYGRIFLKYNRNLKNNTKYAGDFKSTIADNTGKETNWNRLVIVRYDSRKSIQNLTSQKGFKKGFELHKGASLETYYAYVCIME